MGLRGKALCVSIGAMLAAMAVCSSAQAQDASDRCKVEGSVVNSLTGQPVRKARISVVIPGGGEPVSVSTAMPPPAQNPSAAEEAGAYTTLFYPAATEAAAAAPFAITPGQDLRGIDFVLRATSVANIRGRVIKPPGSGRCSVDLEESDGPGMGDFMGGASGGVVFNLPGGDSTVTIDDDAVIGGHRVRPDGTFEFKNIPSGSHTLSARCPVEKQI